MIVELMLEDKRSLDDQTIAPSALLQDEPDDRKNNSEKVYPQWILDYIEQRQNEFVFL